MLVSADRVVLFHHAGRDAPALANCQAVLFRPGPDVTRALTVSRGPPGATRLRPSGSAGMRKVGLELLAERGGVLGVQVNLIVRALEREPDSLLGRAAGQIVPKDDGYFLGHVFTFPRSRVLHRTVAVSCDCEQRRSHPPAEIHTRLDKYFQRPALHVQLRSVTGADGGKRAWDRLIAPFPWAV